MHRIEERFKHGCTYQPQHISFSTILVKSYLLKKHRPGCQADCKTIYKEEEKQEERKVQCSHYYQVGSIDEPHERYQRSCPFKQKPVGIAKPPQAAITTVKHQLFV